MDSAASLVGETLTASVDQNATVEEHAVQGGPRPQPVVVEYVAVQDVPVEPLRVGDTRADLLGHEQPGSDSGRRPAHEEAIGLRADEAPPQREVGLEAAIGEQDGARVDRAWPVDDHAVDAALGVARQRNGRGGLADRAPGPTQSVLDRAQGLLWPAIGPGVDIAHVALGVEDGVRRDGVPVGAQILGLEAHTGPGEPAMRVWRVGHERVDQRQARVSPSPSEHTVAQGSGVGPEVLVGDVDATT